MACRRCGRLPCICIRPEPAILANARQDTVHKPTGRGRAANHEEIAALKSEIAEWRSVFGHLGTPDEAGNAIYGLQREMDAEIARLKAEVERLRSVVEAAVRYNELKYSTSAPVDEYDAAQEEFNRAVRAYRAGEEANP